MKVKTLALVSAILALLAVGAFAVNQWIGAPGDSDRVGQPIMRKVEPEKVARIEIVAAEGTTTLSTADGGTWTVAEQAGFPIDARKIKNLLIKLTSVKLAHKVTERPEKLAALGLLTAAENDGKLEKDKTGRLLTLSDSAGQPLFRMVLGIERRGQGGLTGGGAYVRPLEGAAAYLISESIMSETRPQDWIDGSVLELDAKQALKSVTVRVPGARAIELTHAKAGEAWTLAGMAPAEVDADAVNRLIQQLGKLDIFKVAATDAKPAELGRAKTGHVAFELFDQRRFTMEVGTVKAPDEFRYLSIRAELDPASQDETLRGWVADFNARFDGRLLGVYDWDGSRMLQAWSEYRKRKN